jgi:phytoene dehydrogenase-like protein
VKTDETIVVGGGIAGLMCAAKLANAGRSVTVLEASATLGGRAGTREEEG